MIYGLKQCPINFEKKKKILWKCKAHTHIYTITHNKTDSKI